MFKFFNNFSKNNHLPGCNEQSSPSSPPYPSSTDIVHVKPSEEIFCDGGSNFSKHPLIYLEFKENSKQTICGYCGKIFKREA